MDQANKPDATKDEARAALSQEQPRSARRRRGYEDVTSGPASESSSTSSETTTSTTAAATESKSSESETTDSKSRSSKKKPQEYVTQYRVEGMKDRDPNNPGSGRFVTFEAGDPITVEDCGGEAGLAKLMNSGFVVTKAVWDAKQRAREAEETAREALDDARREQRDARLNHIEAQRRAASNDEAAID